MRKKHATGFYRVYGSVIRVGYRVRCPALFQPMLALVPLQLLVYHAAVLRSHDVYKPRNLAKSVLVE